MSKELQELQVRTSERFAAGARHSQHPFSEVICDNALFGPPLLSQHATVFMQAAYQRKDWDACSRLVPTIKVSLRCAAAAADAAGSAAPEYRTTRYVTLIHQQSLMTPSCHVRSCN